MKNIPLAAAAALYGLAESQLAPVRGGHSNSVYRFEREGVTSILRLTPPDSDVDLPSQRSTLAWMDYLAKSGVCVPAPVKSINGRLLEAMEEEAAVGWTAAAFTQAQGVLSEELDFSMWDASLFEALGRTVGKMHAAAVKYQPNPALLRPHWEQSGSLFCHRPLSLDLAQRIQPILNHLAALPRQPGDYGMIHGDLHFGNFFVDVESGRVTLIDFDDCCRGWYVMDIANGRE